MFPGIAEAIHFKVSEAVLYQHVEQLLDHYGYHAEHQVAKDFSMSFDSYMTRTVIVFQFRIPSFNR